MLQYHIRSMGIKVSEPTPVFVDNMSLVLNATNPGITTNYVCIVMNNSRKHVTTILDNSTHAFNVSFHIKHKILFLHLIGINCTLYTAPVPISQVSDVLIYLDVIVLNSIFMIRQSSTKFTKPGTYIE